MISVLQLVPECMHSKQAAIHNITLSFQIGKYAYHQLLTILSDNHEY